MKHRATWTPGPTVLQPGFLEPTELPIFQLHPKGLLRLVIFGDLAGHAFDSNLAGLQRSTPMAQLGFFGKSAAGGSTLVFCGVR